MDYLVWSAILFALALVFLALEFTLPSAGVLTLFAIVAIISSLVLALQSGWVPALCMLLIQMVLVPVFVAVGIRVWPHTPMGRRAILARREHPDDVLPKDGRERLPELVGLVGVAKTPLLPSGHIAIQGQTYDAVSEGPSVGRGDNVEVTAVRMNRVIVRKTDRAVSVTSQPTEPSSSQQTSGDTLLDRSIEELGIEPLDDPLA